MCKKLLLVGLVLGMAASVASAALVAQYTFDDGTYKDYVGGHNGTAMGSAHIDTGYLHLNNSPASGSYVDIGYFTILDPVPHAFTLSAWVLPDIAVGLDKPIVQKGDEFGIKVKNNDTLEVYFQSAVSSGWYGANIPGTRVSAIWADGLFHHVAGTYDPDAAQIKLYVDGVLEATNTFAGGAGWVIGDTIVQNTTRNWNIGRDSGNTGRLYTGMIDDVRIYDEALSAAEIKKLAAVTKATGPTPADKSTITTTSVQLKWGAGKYAAYHDVYFSDNLADVNTATTATTTGVYKGRQSGTQYPNAPPLIPVTYGKTYYWRIDEVNDPNIWKGNVWSFSVQSLTAYDPSPPDTAKFVATNVVLSWKPGATASYHLIYFGTNYDTVNAMTSYTAFTTGTSWDPCGTGPLAFDKNYYWRIDEVDTLGNTYKGSVWGFKTLPDIPITDPNLIGWWTFEEGEGTTTLDRSGHSNHGTLINGPLWVAGQITGGALQFDGTNDYVVTPSSINLNSNTVTITAWVKRTGNQPSWAGIVFSRTGAACGMGFSSTVNQLQYHWNDNAPTYNFVSGLTVPDNEWAFVALVIEPSQGTLYLNGSTATNSVANTAGTLGVINIGQDSLGGRFVRSTMDDVRIYNKAMTQAEIKKIASPIEAWIPRPANGATDVGQTPTLIWEPGKKAVKHDVYFSDNWDDVNEATTANTSTYPGVYIGKRIDPNNCTPPPLELGQTYYWRIDEVNDPNIWRGNVWSFTTASYLVVDDFENYTNTDPNIIYKTWLDGVGYNPSGNGTGSQAGYRDPNYAEMSIIHGGSKAMPVDYNNTKSPFRSEVDRTPIQDWTAYGVNLLSLWLRGYSGTPPGTFTWSDPNYIMTAAGADIWDVPDLRPHPSKFHDEFRYAYIEVTGNCAMAVKVESITNTNATAKAGVMIRDSLDANSANVMVCLTPSAAGGVRLQHRTTAGGTSTTDANIVSINPPYWIILERSGDEFIAYYGPPGSPPRVGSTTVTMTDPVYIGLALTSHNTAASCTAVFSNVIGVTPPSPWPSQDIGIKNNVAAPVYVTLKDSHANIATITHDDPNIALATTYQEWLIPMARFTSLNTSLDLTNIQKMTLGVRNVGKGTLYFDDIRLYVPRCISGRPGPAGDFYGTCDVNYVDLQLLTNNWLVTEYLVTPVPPPSNDPCLMALYKFDLSDLTDTSNNNRTLDPCGTVPSYVTRAGYGYALALDGNDDYVGRSGVGISGAVPRTIAGWCKASTLTTTASAFINVFGFTNYTGTNYRSFDIERRGSQDYYCIHVYGWERNVAEFDLDWHHLAATYDSTRTIRWYNEGVLMGRDSSITLNTVDHIQMGKRQETTQPNRFPGLVDEVYIYNRALSQGEIAYLATGNTTPITQPLFPLLTPQNPPINMYDDGVIDLRDYAVLANSWLEEKLLWPPPLKSVWAYEFKNDANCYGGPAVKRASDLYLEFNGPVYLVDTGAFGTFTGNGTSKIKLSIPVNTAGSVPPNGSTIIRVGSRDTEKTLNKWYWTDITRRRISNEMGVGVGQSCKKIN